MGDHHAPYSLEDFAQWLRTKYALDVHVLPAMAAEPSAWDSSRRQVVAELLYRQIRREHPDLAADPNTYLIGFTDADMYSLLNAKAYNFTQRYESRFAIVSTDEGMKSYNLELQKDSDAASQRFRARERRILLRDVALLYWRLPLNNDPTSLMKSRLDPGIEAEDIYESDLDPAGTSTGEHLNGSGVFLVYSAKDGIKPVPGRSIQECCENSQHFTDQDESAEYFEVYLSSGLLVDRHTDFNLQGENPIQFQRVTRDGWSGENPFGISGTDTYDEYLSSKDNIRISVIHANGNRDNLLRVPFWMPIDSLVKYVDTDYSGRYYEMRWKTSPFEHYDLRRYDGEVKTYLPCSNSKLLCYLTGYRNAQGQELKFERDESRRLTRLTSSDGTWLRLSYGPGGHIAEIDDSRGRMVRYGYDERNRLTNIVYPSGEIYHYEYDSTQHLLNFSVAPDGNTAPRVLLRNEYENGRITRQTFADGTAYRYKYTLANDGSVIRAEVQTPGGKVFDSEVSYEYSTSTVREQSPRPVGARSQPTSK